MIPRTFEDRHGGRWMYGDGTRNPQGDYYYMGVYREAAGPSLAYMLDHIQRPTTGFREVTIDPDLMLDEGV